MASSSLKIAPGELTDNVITARKSAFVALSPFSTFATFTDMRTFIVREFGLKPSSATEWMVEILTETGWVAIRASELFKRPPAVRLTADKKQKLFVLYF